MRVACIQSVWFAREKGKEKKNPHALVKILSSLYFLPIWEERKMLALWRTLHFPFPRSISLQTNKGFFFSFLPLLFLAFPSTSLQPNIYIYMLSFFIFQREGNRIHDEENEGYPCSSRVLFCIFCIFFLMRKKASNNGLG